MSEQMIAALIGGISGSIFSGVIYWLLDKRREMKKDSKHKQARKDLINLLKMFMEIQEEYKSSRGTKILKSYFGNIGLIRHNKIITALEKMDLLKVNTTLGGYSMVLLHGYDRVTKNDIRVLIKDVNKGNYDNCFEVI